MTNHTNLQDLPMYGTEVEYTSPRTGNVIIGTYRGDADAVGTPECSIWLWEYENVTADRGGELIQGLELVHCTWED